MKKIFLLTLTLLSIQAKAQFDIAQLDNLYDGEIIDSTVTKNLMLYEDFYPYYYSFKAKYPESTQTLLVNCQKFLKNKIFELKGSGYITFTFMIDNEGKINYVKYTQIDEFYKATKFNKKAVLAIYDFIKTLDKWKKARYHDEENNPISYITFMSFKIENANKKHTETEESEDALKQKEQLKKWKSQ